MQQLFLPLDGAAATSSASRPRPNPRRKKSSDERGSSEEKSVQTLFAAPAPQRTEALTGTSSALEPLAGSAVPRPWPAALTWEDALQYTSLSEAELRRGVRRGIVRFKCVGRRGGRVAARDQLDRLIADVFEPEPVGVEEDFDFG
jgi:hypothetical protein